MSDPTTVQELLTQIWTLLETTRSVPSDLGARRTNQKSPRYSWEPSTITPSDPGDDYVQEARRLHDLGIGFDVVCFAETIDGCLQMAADLVTAVRQVLRGASYTLGAFEWAEGSGESSTKGWALIVPLTLRVALLESDLDQPPVALALVTSVRVDDSGGTDGDGELVPPNR